MNKHLYPLLIAQFLSAFADNAILFTVVALVLQAGQVASWYVPALQSVFLIAAIVFAPWVGHFADHHSKSRILLIGNILKAIGAALLLAQVEPLIAYCIVGLGSAIYSPAKYGILPELVEHDLLMKANGWMEASTILAVLSGMVVGAKVADYSTYWALLGTIILFALSAILTLWLPTGVHKPVLENTKGFASASRLLLFGKQMQLFFTTTRSRFAILGGSLFWATAATLRVVIIAWAPLVLATHNASDIAELTFFLALGIIVGSAVVPYFIPLEQLERTRFAAYGIGLFLVALSFVDHLQIARATLFLIGMMGGIFIVPINAALQDIGQHSIGSGGAVAMQNFFQNTATLIAVGSYTYAAAHHITPVAALLGLGGLVLNVTFVVSLGLRRASQNFS